ncbi:OB-fold protein [Corallococcus interemptor]|uniref:OB-fold protein n=1 Tax=Corallococcus interemptor TaxID=2316720 RepID=UPI001ABF1936|nr:hypothetical protein [Corallococcus interemptor]
MALVKCRECGNDVATSAAACPKCGAPVRRQLLTTRNILLAFCALGLCYVGSCVALNLADTSGRAAKPTSATGEPKQVDIGPFLRAYASNELLADANYRGHLIKTSGWAEGRGRDPLGNVFLVLASASSTEPTKLHCFIPEQHVEKVANLSRGAHITIRGRVSGLAADKVVVTGCELVDQ